MPNTPHQTRPAEARVTKQPLLTLPSTSRMLGTIKLPGILSAPSTARTFVHSLLTGWADDRLDDAMILVTELVSNAARHSDSGRDPDGTMTLQVTVVDGFINIQVTDQGSARSVPYLVPDPEQRESGFGLHMVDHIASEWGHDYGYEGRRIVWGELAPPPEDDDNAAGQARTWTELMCQRVGDRLDLYVKAGLIELPPDTYPAPPAKQRRPRQSEQAAHREQITEILVSQIVSGELPEGTPIPTAHTLMDTYGVSPWTAMQIHHALRERGLIRRVPGHGYVVGAPGPPPDPVRPPVREQVVHIAAVLIRKIRRGQIAPHARVATIPELMKEHGISKRTAWDVLCLLRVRGYAYSATHTRAATFDNWPPEGTSLEMLGPPPSHVRKSSRRKPQLTLVPNAPETGTNDWTDNDEHGHHIEVGT
ncbi:GntR family transcriptional regulator [Acrocarpospora catenulata]|uniref:GntR family transcriptional regulator n=1 Tax=Acrocarpospora catenulata TaxID=2836182 RepID=UPI001BDAFB5B|nr:GntR family transcriptional regulator [Acrocarpospora catenulata]